jgi:membrane-bound serine protease (ClpP class)
MHGWLAFIAGILIVIGAVLIFSASIGITYLGLALQVEAIIAIILLIIAGITTWIFYIGIKAQYVHIKTGQEALLGSTGITTTELNPNGEVRVLGEFWQASAKDNLAISNGKEIKVVDMKGMFLVVEPIEQKA